MANYATLTAWIEAYIKTNGQQAITGQVLQTTLKKMVATLGDGYRLAGVATPEGTPEATDNDIYYLAAEAGTYTNYGGAVLDGSTLHLLTYSDEWGDIDTGVATATALAAVAQALGADIEAVAEVKADKASSNPAMLVGSALGIMGNTPQAALYTHRAVPSGVGSGAAQFRMLRGKSLVWNQLVGADTESVTIPSGNKYYAVIGGVASVGISDGTAIAVTGGTDMVVDLTQLTMPDLTAPAFAALYPGYHGYNAGSIINLMATGIKTKDADNNDLYTLALNIPTLKGKAGGVGESVVIYPNGMMSAGTAYDYGRVDADGWWRRTQRVMKMVNLVDLAWTWNGTYSVWQANLADANGVASSAVGNVLCGRYSIDTLDNVNNRTTDKTISAASTAGNIRLYDSSFNSQSDLSTLLDGVMYIYELATPIEYTLDTPIYCGYPVDADGTETMLPDQTGLSEPTSAPIDCDVIYPVKVATAADLAAAIAAEAEALNAFAEANELGGSFAVVDGVLTYTPGE